MNNYTYCLGIKIPVQDWDLRVVLGIAGTYDNLDIGQALRKVHPNADDTALRSLIKMALDKIDKQVIKAPQEVIPKRSGSSICDNLISKLYSQLEKVEKSSDEALSIEVSRAQSMCTLGAQILNTMVVKNKCEHIPAIPQK